MSEIKLRVYIPSLDKWFEEDNTKIQMTEEQDCTLYIKQECSPRGNNHIFHISKVAHNRNANISIEPDSANSFKVK